MVPMFLMAVTGLVLVAGMVLTLWWRGTGYETWGPPAHGTDGTPGPSAAELRPSVRTSALRYLRGAAIALVGGFWAGAIVTGPSVRLIMRLLAVTAGDDAQGRLTEAEEVVGSIDLGGTIGLIVFGGIVPGLLSGAIYVVFRRWLPSGRLGGVVFGALHLVIAATRIDPCGPTIRTSTSWDRAGWPLPPSDWRPSSTPWPSWRSPIATATTSRRRRAPRRSAPARSFRWESRPWC
jgi:hypothetical protein